MGSIRDNIRWAWQASAGRRVAIAVCCVMEVLHIAVSMVFIWISKHIIDIATGNSDGTLGASIVYLVVCVLVQQGLSIACTRMEIIYEIRLRGKLRQRLFTKIMDSRWTGRESMHSGDFLNRLMEDVQEVSETLCLTVPRIAATVAQLVLATLLISKIDVRLAAVLFFIMPVALVLSKSFFLRLRKLSRDIKDTDSKVQSHIQENIRHRMLISAFEQTDAVSDTLYGLQENLTRKVTAKTDYALFSRTLIRLGFAAGYATVLIWGAYGLMNGTLTFGIMAAFLQLVSQIQRPAVEFSRLAPGLIRTSASIERLCEIDFLPQEEHGEQIMLAGCPGIRISGLDYSYPDSSRHVFSNFSYDFTPGSRTEIIGETGIGKSTLIRLILAQLSPNSGHITLYDNEKEVPAGAMTRCNFIYVPQGNSLISGTIRENLMLGKPDATEEEMTSALYDAAVEFVMELPDGLDTICGESGTGLSEGQAQRIAIARGLLRPGGIMLLDEPTSALDSNTEHTLLERLSRCSGTKTIIIITHKEAASGFCTGTLRIKS